MNDIETSNMSLTVNDDTRSSHVTAASDHDNVSGVEFDKVHDFALFKIKLDSVVDVDGWVGVSDCAAIVSDDMWNTFCA
jgi:hypothetical protein